MIPEDAKLAQMLDNYLNLTNRDYGFNGPQNRTQLNLLQASIAELERLQDQTPVRTYEYGVIRGVLNNLMAMQTHEEEERIRHSNVIAVLDKHLPDFKDCVKRFKEMADLVASHRLDKGGEQ